MGLMIMIVMTSKAFVMCVRYKELLTLLSSIDPLLLHRELAKQNWQIQILNHIDNHSQAKLALLAQ